MDCGFPNTLPRHHPLQSIRSIGRRAIEPVPMSTVVGLVAIGTRITSTVLRLSLLDAGLGY